VSTIASVNLSENIEQVIYLFSRSRALLSYERLAHNAERICEEAAVHVLLLYLTSTIHS
jgi:hypothetical protein